MHTNGIAYADCILQKAGEGGWIEKGHYVCNCSMIAVGIDTAWKSQHSFIIMVKRYALGEKGKNGFSD